MTLLHPFHGLSLQLSLLYPHFLKNGSDFFFKDPFPLFLGNAVCTDALSELASITPGKGLTYKFILTKSVFSQMQIWLLYWVIIFYSYARTLEMPEI